MGIFDRLGVAKETKPTIDWGMTPDATFAIFESWGGEQRIKSDTERFYYFYINGWETPARVCLMERGIKFARVLAEIDAPQNLVAAALAKQGKTGALNRSYPIDEELKAWLKQHVVDTEDDSKLVPVDCGLEEESLECGLPLASGTLPAVESHRLRSEPGILAEEELPELATRHNFFDSRNNPDGTFHNELVDNGDRLTITDRVTGLMWQRGGYDITSIRNMKKQLLEINQKKLAGFNDWRLPTVEEALSLLEPQENSKSVHLHPCFSKHQPYIFTADERRPGGYWFVDFKQATAYWASGTIPGGFGRLVRTI